MEIKVKCSCGGDTCPEWAIVEVQGVVEAQPSFQDHLQNLEIGQLCRPSSQENYTFTVGYHELTGSKVPLKKPLLVLKKIKYMDVDQTQTQTGADSPSVELQVVGIIRHRILFKTRPKAIISSKLPFFAIISIAVLLIHIHLSFCQVFLCKDIVHSLD
ncbi:Ctf8 domain-containing protein [Cephalotus follicularis]|uniref:Ctf8 domain-containing protein n=1 Tax=Cephalotus follicularis TaxID=3775 RepID=A0A1Q3BWZ0_CEPFO|nr:Ctf8 domain-containing protein [Cephalotus follicularis]